LEIVDESPIFANKVQAEGCITWVTSTTGGEEGIDIFEEGEGYTQTW